MSWMNRLRALFRRDKLNRDLADELKFHVEMRTRENVAAGMSPKEARDAALRQFGNVGAVTEETREAWGLVWLESIAQDVRYGMRGFRRSPAFTLTALAAIALGIGSTTAVFSVVDRLLFRGLPYPNAGRLVTWGVIAPIEQDEFMLETPYVALRGHYTPFEAVTSFTPGISDCDLTDQNPVRVECARIESTFLPTFGILPVVGRNFTREEDQPHAPKVALISYGLWRNRFSGDAGVVGKTFPLDGQPTRIVGVLPRNFEFPTLALVDVLVPQALDESAARPTNTGRVLRTFARLKPGVSLRQAAAELEPLYPEFIASAPMQFRKEIRLSVRSLRDRQTEQVHLAALILLGAVLAVLLIASANVASLMLARAASRRRELAMRAALGAGRARLIRQTLTESLLLGLMGGAAGCVLAEALRRAFTAIAPRGIPRLEQAHVDLRVLAFALGVSLLCGILFGVVPALETPRAETLAGWHTVGVHRQRFRQALVTMQIAVSLVLLAGASLLLRSLWNLENEPLGMRAAGVMTVAINLGQRYPEPARQLAFFETLESRLRQLPGVQALAVSDSLPPGGPMHGGPYAGIEVEGRPRFMEGTGGMVAWRLVTPDYFAALDIPILRGRGFTEADRRPGQHVIILSESLAHRLFPGEDPLGQEIRHGFEGPWFTVVGIAANVKNGGLAEPADPEFYLVRRHSADDAAAAAQVILRTSTGSQAMAHWARSEIAGLDPTLPISIETMQQRVGTFSVQPRFDAALLGLFALMGLLLAAVGIYGVIAFLVTQQTQEIGVRMALGATRGDVLKLFAGRGLNLISIGVALGLIAALALSRVLSSLLYGVRPDDPATFAVVILGLAGVGLLATYMPAR